MLRLRLVFGTQTSDAHPRVAAPDGSNNPNLQTPADRMYLYDEHRREAGILVHDTDGEGTVAWVVKHGILRNCAAYGEQWAAGDIVWADSQGNPTTVRPPADHVRVQLGYVFKTNTFAEDEWQDDWDLFVNVKVLPPLGELSGVNLEDDPPVYPEVLMVENIGVGYGWKNKQLVHGEHLVGNEENDHPQYEPIESGFQNAQDDTTLSFDSGTRTLTITPTGASFTVWSGGYAWVKSSPETIVISDVEGIHRIYYDASGVLQDLVNGDDETLDLFATVCTIYWNVPDQQHPLFIGQRHGRSMDSVTRRYNKNTVGTRLESGFSITLGAPPDSSGNLDSHAQFGISDGIFWRADLRVSVEDDSPQQLSPSPGQFPIHYLSGAGALLREFAATDFMVATVPAGRAYFNDPNAGGAGVWGLTEIGNGNFGLMHVFATNEIEHPIILIMGQAEHNNTSQARAAAETELPQLVTGALAPVFDAFLPIATLIFETKNASGNAVKSRIISTSGGGHYIDWRSVPASAQGISVSVHNNLSGIQGGSVSERYHLEASQHAIATDPTFTITGTLVSPTGILTPINIISWQAPYDCEVLAVAGYRVGGSSATVNARKNGSSTHLSSDLTLGSADTWLDGGAVQNETYTAGDKLEIMITGVTAAPTQIAVQLKMRRV